MFHKAIALQFNEGTSLEVTFQSGEVKLYDMSVLFDKYPKICLLKNREFFLSGKLAGAYGIIWNDEIDIEVETIYEDGVTVRRIPVSASHLAAEAISEARAQIGMSQKELSIKSGIDQSDISKIERGIANPSVNTIERLAKAMGMELQILIK